VKYLKKSEELVSIATGFGGGIGMKDLCGFFTGGVMAIGLFSGRIKAEDRDARSKCSKLTREFTAWWKENFPLHCSEIRTEGTTGETCDNVGDKASEFLQKLLEREKKNK